MGFNSKYTGAQVETILDALNGISYDPITHSFVFEGNIIVTGGAAFRALLGDLDVPTIMDAIVVDEENITFDYTTGQPILTISDELKEKLGGLNEDELERYLTYHKYLTESSIKGLNFVDKKYLENYFKNNAVTLDTNQEIEGIKNFLNGIQINNSSIISYDPDTKSFVFDGNLIVTGGGAFRAALGDLDVPTIMDAVTVDEHTIIKEGGILKINPNIDLSGGIKPEELQPYLEPYAKIDDVANTYATIVDLSVLNSRINDFLSGSDTDTIINKWKELEVFLSGLSESDNLSTLLSNKANKATTLAGYGITDAYTKTQIDTSVSAINKTITDLRTYTDKTFVKLDVAQDIKVRHNFTEGLKIGGLSAYKSQDDVVFIDANVVVRGGITAWGNNSQTAPTIWDGLPIDNETIKRDANGLFYAEVQNNSGLDHEMLDDYLTTNGYITSENFHDYALPITGGTVNGQITINHSGNTPLVINQNYGTVSNPRGVVVMNSTLSNSNLYISHLFGKEGSMRNSAWVGFYLDSAGSNNNRLSMGLYGVDNVLNILGSGNVSIGGTTASEKLHVYGNVAMEGCVKISKSTYPDIRGNGSYITFSPDDVNGSKGSIGLYKNLDGSYALRRVWDHYSYGVVDLGASEYRWHTIYAKSGNFSDYVTATSFVGNASSASKLKNSVSLWGRTFDGSADLTGSLTVTTGEGYRISYNNYDLRFIISGNSSNRGIWDNTNSEWMMYRNSSTNVFFPQGNVGFGTTSPTERVTVNGAIDSIAGNSHYKVKGKEIVGSYNTNYYLFDSAPADGYTSHILGNVVHIKSGSNKTSALTANADGTTSIHSTLKLPAVDSGFANPRITFGDTKVRIGVTTAGLLGIYASGDIRINPNSAESANSTMGLFLKSTGFNGINISSPTQALHVNGKGIFADTTNPWVSLQRDGVNWYLQVTSGGLRLGRTSTNAVGIDESGNLQTPGAVTMFYSSDRRLKQNIRKANASKTLLSLGGVYKYEYIDSEVMKNNTYGGSHYGLIYQNVKGSALTSMCHEREDGMGSLNYLDTNFISLVAGATMENTTEIEKLKKENKNLRIEIELLKQRVI